MILPPQCAGCPEAAKALSFVPPDVDPPGLRLRPWGERPGSEEAAQGRGFVGPSGKKLRRAARWAGLDCWSGWEAREAALPEEIACSNAVLCYPGNNTYPGDEIAQECLRRHGHGGRPEAPTLLCGANATEALTGFRLNPLRTRGSVLPLLAGGWGVMTIHPAYILRGQDEAGSMGKAMEHLEPLLTVDVKRALGGGAPQVPRVHIMGSPAELAQAFSSRDWGDKKPVLAVDIEGRDGAPTVLGLSWASGEAWVIPWGVGVADVLERILAASMPVYHNAAYDVPELHLAGVKPPAGWLDTIVTAGLHNPDWPKGLQPQVLTHVPGTTAWKGLIDHAQGYAHVGPEQATYRRLWTRILDSLGRTAPADAHSWYLFYNGLDVAWTRMLAEQHFAALGREGRKRYYLEVLKPLQAPLIEMGLRGLPTDAERLAYHRTACQRLQRMATGILADAGRAMLEAQVAEAQAPVLALEAERAAEGGRAFSKAAELTKARSKFRAAEARLEAGFTFDSSQQAAQLFYDWYGLPPVSSRKSGNRTTDDDAIESLLLRLTKKDHTGAPAPTIKPKRGTRAEVIRLLQAKAAGKKWATWERNFLRVVPSGVQGLVWLKTQYSLHRTATGRLASGRDDSDLEKGGGKKQQLQNVPRKIRDMVVAPPGQVLVGGDWAGIEWALPVYFCAKMGSAFHAELLRRFRAGDFDPHRYLASIVFGKDESLVTRDERKLCKPYTHGRTFMGSPVGLAAEAGHSLKTGHLVCNAHDAAFRFKDWQQSVLDDAKRRHFTQTPLGWRRYFWAYKPKPQEVLGTYVQGTAADLCKWILGRIFADPNVQRGRASVLTTTHDSILIAVDELDREWGVAWLRECMEASVPWTDGHSWRADVKSGRTWRDVS